MLAGISGKGRSGTGIGVMLGVLMWMTPLAFANGDPRLPVSVTVRGSNAIKPLVETRLLYELKQSDCIDLVPNRSDSHLQLDINAVDLSTEELKLPIIAISVVVLESQAQVSFFTFAMRNGTRLGSKGLLYAFIRGDHLRTVCQHAVYTTSTTRISQTCETITRSLEELHVEPRLKITRWIQKVARDFTALAKPILAAQQAQD